MDKSRRLEDWRSETQKGVLGAEMEDKTVAEHFPDMQHQSSGGDGWGRSFAAAVHAAFFLLFFL